MFKAGKKKKEHPPSPVTGLCGVSDRWLAGTGGKDVGAASLLPVQAAHLFPSAQHWNLFLWQSCCGLRLLLTSSSCLLVPLSSWSPFTASQSCQSWQPVEATHRLAQGNTHLHTSQNLLYLPPGLSVFPIPLLPLKFYGNGFQLFL